ncbi:unnamed protein product [Boreogadus saida]
MQRRIATLSPGWYVPTISGNGPITYQLACYQPMVKELGGSVTLPSSVWKVYRLGCKVSAVCKRVAR